MQILHGAFRVSFLVYLLCDYKIVVVDLMPFFKYN